MFKLFVKPKAAKRGSLELSINAIIIVVLAMTLLGLGLNFIRQMFTNISGTTVEVQEQVREQITSQLRTSGEKISFPRSLQFGRGEQKVITLGVQNTGIQTMSFKIAVSLDSENSDSIEGTAPDKIFNLRYDKSCMTLSPSDARVEGINVVAPKAPGTFALKADVTEYEKEDCTGTSSTYASKLAFITVG